MKVRYDPDADALYIRFNDSSIYETEEISPGVMLDIDAEGKLVGLEILDAAQKIGKPPLTVEVELPKTAAL
ncbi:hypothetical protein MHOCP_23310 [Moorella humiferrea]|uniref:DUF2283 domain-containing protein n=1 Tax=Neomoorella humiferrea TaxID=676965 RepID=UPI0030CD98EC